MNKFGNAISDVKVLINKIKGSGNNLVNSVYFGMRAPGVKSFIDRIDYVEAKEFLNAMKMKKNIGLPHYRKAEHKFLISPEGLATVNTKEKLTIVLAIGLANMYQLFDDKYFASRNEKGINHINGIFSIATAEQKEYALANGLLKYFEQTDKKQYWTPENREVLEFLASIFISSLGIYGPSVDKDLATYLVDTYGLNLAFITPAGYLPNKEPIFDNEKFADVVGYASASGFSTFIARPEIANQGRMTTIEKLLFLRNNMDALGIMVGTLGCKNADIERHLLYLGTLPLGSVRKGLCFPRNFEALMDTFGAPDVAANFPEQYKSAYPNLWEWVQTGLKPAKVEKTGGLEWSFVLASPTLCKQYLAEGGKFTREDISTLLSNGMDEIIELSRK